jgi:hypothetical protein
MGIFILFLAAISGHSYADTPHMGVLEEIPLNNVFIPANGYDDNDDVGIVTDGVLPTSCYSIGPVIVDTDAAKRLFRVHQMAYHDQSGYCQSPNSVPSAYKRPVPFTREFQLGQLAAADYQIIFTKLRMTQGQRKFTVAVAPTRSVDSLPYAVVTGIDLPDWQRVGGAVDPVLTGVLTSSCAHLNTDVSILDEGDVFVALPTQTFDDVAPSTPVKCTDTFTPFRLPVHLGTPATGRYLLHARSMGGKAVNKVFGVFQD